MLDRLNEKEMVEVKKALKGFIKNLIADIKEGEARGLSSDELVKELKSDLDLMLKMLNIGG